jgi:hypothetical protein
MAPPEPLFCREDPGFDMTLILMEMFNSSHYRSRQARQPSGHRLSKNFSAVKKAEVVCDYSHLD